MSKNCTKRDLIRNQAIYMKLGTNNVNDKIEVPKEIWKPHLTRMSSESMYKSTGHLIEGVL